MRALISGAGGFVASHLIDYLLKNTDWIIYGMMRWDDRLDNLQHLMDEINNGGRIKLIQGDLEDLNSLHLAVSESQPDYVFHLAAQSYVQTSFRIAAKTLSTNVIGTENLMDALRRRAPDALVHNCSSSEVYGKVDADYGPIDESCPLAPASPYSISKIGQDFIGRYYHEAYGLKVMTTRMFTHTGARRGDVFFESSFAKQIAMIEAGLIPRMIKVGNLYSIRTIADVRDAVRAYFLLLTHNPQSGEIYNIGGTHTCMVGDVLDYLNKSDIPVIEDQSRMRPLDANFQIPDYSKFTAHTGWMPEYTFEQTMDDLLDYWREEVKTRRFLQR